jgi:hypothetical protein
MYGTIGHLPVKPGMETEITLYLHDFEKVPGVVSSSLYCMDAPSHDYYWPIVWLSKEVHDANASSADFPTRYAQLLNLLTGDPEWHSGECMYTQNP